MPTSLNNHRQMRIRYPRRAGWIGPQDVGFGSGLHSAHIPATDCLVSLKHRINEMLKRLPVAVMSATREQLLLIPTGEGFPITVLALDNKLVLCFGGWHEDEYPPHIIANLINLALSGAIRLREEFINGKPLKHAVDVTRDHQSWQSMGEIGYFRLNFLRAKKTCNIRSFERGGRATESNVKRPRSIHEN